MSGDHQLTGDQIPPVSSPTTQCPPHLGNRRRDCWWEPIYDPSFKLEGEPYDWNLERDAGPYRRFIPASALIATIRSGDILEIKNRLFRECDFQGVFQGDPIIMFEGCSFERCDLAYSTWRRCHFKNCVFKDCSLSLSTFDGCELRGCSWENIGLASRTELNRTFLSNPEKLIPAMVSRANPASRTRKHRMHQWFRLQGTRAHFLRNVMLSHATTGDEHTYYKTVKLHELRRCFARVAEDMFNIVFDRGWKGARALPAMILHGFNYVIMLLLGGLNGWGESAGRPFLALLGCWTVAGVAYSHLPFSTAIASPFQKSFDITFLVGYTNQAAPCDQALTIVQDVHALLAIVIYTVFFATVISKVARAR